MALTLAQLLASRTKVQLRAQLLQALQGVGFVRHTGASGAGTGQGTGSVSVSGVASADADLVVKIIDTGELGAASFEYSADAGETWSAETTVPSGGTYALSSYGVLLTFARGPTGSGDSFVEDDLYACTLAAPTLPTTSWQTGSVPLTLVDNDAQVCEDFDRLITAVASGGFIDYATGNWLDLLAPNVYGITRNPSGFTTGTVLVTDAASAGPSTVTAGQIWVANAAGKRFSNVSGFTLTRGGSISVAFKAESPGAAYNLGNGTITTVVSAPLAGLTVSNPDPGPGSWISQVGVDTESDAALRIRCKARWATAGIAANADGYAFWARTASASVARVYVEVSPTVEGEVDVYLAGPTGTVSAGDVDDVQDYIDPRIPLTSTCVVAAATEHPVTVMATVYVDATHLLSAPSEAEAALEEYFASLGIGDDVSLELVIGCITRGSVRYPVVGVSNATVSAPAADVTIPVHEVATLTVDLTWVVA